MKGDAIGVLIAIAMLPIAAIALIVICLAGIATVVWENVDPYGR